MNKSTNKFHCDLRHPTKKEMNYSKLLKGKRVALVASGSSLKDSGRGDFVDSFDVVIRLNRALPVPTNIQTDVGKRTDVLYNTLDTFPDAGGPIDGNLWKSCGVKYVCSTYPKSEYFTHPEWSEGLNDIIPTRWMRDEVYHPIREKMKYRPNSGITALADLLSFDIKEVHLLGMDFYRTLYDTDYLIHGATIESIEEHFAENVVDRHDPDSMYLYFKNEMYPNDDRIIIDNYFKDILKDPKYDSMFFIKEKQK